MIRPLLAALLVGLAAAPALAASKADVVVLRSDDLEPYARFTGGFGAAWGGSVSEQSCRGQPDRCTEVARKLAERAPDLVVALGPLAATSAAKAGLPVLFALVPAHEKYGLTGKYVAGIALARPYRAQLEALAALAPSAKKIGVLYDPRRSEATVEAVSAAARELGLSLVKGKVEDVEPGAVAKAVAKKADALFLVPDPSIGSDAAFSELLAVARKSKLPTFALTEGMVREGMLLAFSPDYGALGAQAAKLAGKATTGSLEKLGVVAPEGVELAVNLDTAAQLGLGDDDLAALLRYARKAGCAVRPVTSEAE